MCGRLVNLDTVARVLAEYYHLKTDTQLAALDEALSKVPAVSGGGGHGKEHVADPNKMVEDLISRRAALDTLAEWHDEAITNRLNNLPSAQPKWIPCKTALPEKDREICLVCGKKGGMCVASFWSNGTHSFWVKTGTGKSVYPVAWMPLPKPWKGNADD